MAKRKWKTLKGFKNIEDYLYQVSMFGEVRYAYSKEKLHVKIANKKNHPYIAVYLKNKNGKKEWVLVHQLVAFCFVKIPKKYKNNMNDLVPDHLDNNGVNNFYKNLEWKTRGENVKASFERGEMDNSGENHKGSLITNEQAEKICKMLEDGFSYDDILSEMNFPNNKSYRKLLIRIKNRIAWKEISKNYNFDSKKIKYTPVQLDTISKLPKIRELISKGYTNMEIVRSVWGELPKNRMDTKSQTVTLIRKGELFKEIPEGSTTIENISSQEIVNEKK